MHITQNTRNKHKKEPHERQRILYPSDHSLVELLWNSICIVSTAPSLPFLALFDYISRAHGMGSLSIVRRPSPCRNFVRTDWADSFQISVVASPGHHVSSLAVHWVPPCRNQDWDSHAWNAQILYIYSIGVAHLYCATCFSQLKVIDLVLSLYSSHALPQSRHLCARVA